MIEEDLGRYLVVNLYNFSSKERLYFDKGEYVLTDPNFYRVALINFGRSIIENLESSSFPNSYRVYIRGSADQLGEKDFSRKQDPRFRTKEVCYLKNINSNKYVKKEICEKFPDTILNRHLPNLRAEYLRALYEGYLATFRRPVLLEGSVSYNVSWDDRNATIYLFLGKNLLKN